MGGGTFDISYRCRRRGLRSKATNGATHGGGDDFDPVLIRSRGFGVRSRTDIDRKDRWALQRLKEACEQAKKALSQQTHTSIICRLSPPTHPAPKHLQLEITRAKFEQLWLNLIERCKKPGADRHQGRWLQAGRHR